MLRYAKSVVDTACNVQVTVTRLIERERSPSLSNLWYDVVWLDAHDSDYI